MKFLVFTLTTLVLLTTADAQDTIQQTNQAILDEGKQLYHSEMASWYGTDLFLVRFKDQRENIGGYFSYSEGILSKCLFYSNTPTPTVLATITFDSTYNINTAQVEGPRNLTPFEMELYTIRKKALDDIYGGDSLYRTYKDMNLNLIPIINNGQRKVYVLTGPQKSGVVVFGNDYLLTFDTEGNLTSQKQLHRNIITSPYSAGSDTEVIGSMHTHLPETGDFITATDVCTLMLYQKFAKWKQHIVISEHYMNIWDCESNQIATLTREAWERINGDQKKRRKKR
jgi:hypothetical protein